MELQSNEYYNHSTSADNKFITTIKLIFPKDIIPAAQRPKIYYHSAYAINTPIPIIIYKRISFWHRSRD